MKGVFLAMAAALALVCLGVAAQADVFSMGTDPDGTVLTNLETVPVGDPGNGGDGRFGGYGSVSYNYNIGKYEITAAQYCEFLNAKAQTDTYGLYNDSMAHPEDGWLGCNIQRTGTDGSYSYSVASDWANRPVNCVSFWDAARFANWLGNGQQNGDTENGAYTLTAGGIATNTVTRNPGWKWAVTSEDEWYKAAYYDPSYGYWDVATRTTIFSMPSNKVLNPDPGNSANYYNSRDEYSIGLPYLRTNVGEFENSASAYGTFDQSGNVTEWNEAIVNDGVYSYRGMRGGSFWNSGDSLIAATRIYVDPASHGAFNGFRVSQNAVPSLTRIGGTITLESWTAPGTVSIPADISYVTNGGAAQTLATTLAVTSSGGKGTATYEIPDLAPGVYDVLVKPSHWLAQKLTGVDVSAASVSTADVTCKNGDITGHNVVNFSDYLVLQTQYKKTPGSPTADLNGDGAVNFSDYLILQANYKKSGDGL